MAADLEMTDPDEAALAPEAALGPEDLAFEAVAPHDLPADWLLRTRLKLRHLQLLLALGQHRNLHRAAATLHLSQPAASKMLAEVERMLGVSLFDRLPRGVEPNWYGEVLIRHAAIVIAELGQAGAELAALKAGEGGAVAIGSVMAPAVDAVVTALGQVRSQWPRLRVTVHVENSDTLIARLREATIDFAIARIPPTAVPEDFTYEEVGEEDICFLVRSGHPLASRPLVALDDLRGLDWVNQPRGTLLRRRVERLFLSRGVPLPDTVIDTPSVLLAVAVVAKTDAITALSRSVAELFAGPGFTFLNVGETVTVEPYGLITVRDKPLSPAARTIYDAVRVHLLPGR